MATEIRFAFALNGGVSLAIWIGGVVDEILRFVDAGRRISRGETDGDNPYVALCRELDVVPKVDVLAGSSAGGLNAAFLGTAVVHGSANLHAIKRLWIDHGSFDEMLRSPADPSPISVLNGDDNFLPHIEEAFKLLAKDGTGFTDVDPPVTVRLTATSLGGRVSTLTDGSGEISSIDHRAEFVFRTRDFDFESDERAVPRLARACRSSASFPGAFEPSTVPVDLYDRGHLGDVYENAVTTTTPMIDGGVLVNLPAQSAIDAIIRQPSRERIERVLALVVPDPGEVPASDAPSPTLNDVLSKSIVGIPRTQSLTEFVRELNEHNLEVRSRRAAREAMLAQFAEVPPHEAWAALANVAGSLFSAYRAARVARAVERARLGLPALLATTAPADTAVAGAIDADAVPWVPKTLDLGGREWCWGAGTVRRLASVLTTWINAAATGQPPAVAARLYAVKDAVSQARAAADEVAPDMSAFEHLFVDELLREGASVTAAFEGACRRWPADDTEASATGIATLNEQLVALAKCLADFVALARDTNVAALRGLVRLHDGAAGPSDATRLLLCIEVVEATFAGTEPRPDQEIRLIQFTARGAIAIDPLGRDDPADKLAGVELAHFGAFLKRSWRANDWMWGRLDASQRVVTLLDSMLDHRLTREGSFQRHARSIQAAVLREELPTVMAEIEQDSRLGGRVSTEAKAFCQAVRAVTNTTDRPVDLSGLDEEQIGDLFALQVVGSENLEREVGSDLATLTSIAALATTAAVMRAQGPRMLRAPIGLLGASSSMAWRISRRRQGRRLRVLEGALVVVIAIIGVAGTAVDLFTSIDLGAFRYVAWSLLVVAPILALFAAPWLLLAFGRRAMGRQKPH